jgi:hypothetical protein
MGGGGVSNREQRSSSRSRRGGVSENQIAGAAAARLFFLTAVAIAIATRPFKFHEISVTNTSSSFVSSIHSLGKDCQYKDRSPWISTGNPRVMSHSSIYALHLHFRFMMSGGGEGGRGGRGGEARS